MSEQYQAYYRSPIGMLNILGTEQGISKISFTEDNQADCHFEQSEKSPILSEGFLDAKTASRNDMPVCLTACVRQLDEYFNGTRKEFSIHLDLRGTEFQKRVWQELLTIPFGTTTSYLKVASSLGDKKALRAVGRANGQNPIVILVPCHRVIGTDGSLTGYGGGLWRKEWLLNFEGSRLQPGLLTARPWVIDASRR